MRPSLMLTDAQIAAIERALTLMRRAGFSSADAAAAAVRLTRQAERSHAPQVVTIREGVTVAIPGR